MNRNGTISSTITTWRGLRVISGNPIVRTAALFGRRIPWVRDRPLRFTWGERPFRARPVDVHGSVISVFVLREYDGLMPRLRQRENLVILDAGANVGAFALFMKSEFPSARVVSVEASIDTHGVLAENVARSGWADWSTYNCALWDHDGTVGFADHATASANSAVVGLDNSAPGRSTVPARRLDGLIAELLPATRISLLKLDIEGAEERVLASVRGKLAMVDSLVIEIHAHVVDEDNVLKLLREEFATVDRLPTSDDDERVYFAGR
jgi:FkbM family methyltransferase